MPRARVVLEIAVDNVADALAAARAGAARLELCAALDAHGLTASRELVTEVVAALPAPVRTVAMVRPAPGACVHDASRWRTAMSDAVGLLEAGAGGVVFGCVTVDGEIDEDRVREMVRLAGTRDTVFHRAFDLLEDPVAAVARLADLGVTRVLTSGMSAGRTAGELGEPVPALAGRGGWHAGGDDWDRRIERVRALVSSASEKIEVLIGGGVRAANVREIIVRTGCTQVHSSARTGTGGTMDAVEVGRLSAAIR